MTNTLLLLILIFVFLIWLRGTRVFHKFMDFVDAAPNRWKNSRRK